MPPPSQQRSVLLIDGSMFGHSQLSSYETERGGSVHLFGSLQFAKMLGITVRVDMGVIWVLSGIIICQFMAVSSDDIVVACGGFVKSDVEINYSLIEVRVQTSQEANVS